MMCIALICCPFSLNSSDDFLLRTQKIGAASRPTRRYQNALYNMIHNDNNISPGEATWIRRSDDLASIARDAESGWVNEKVEWVLNHISKKLLLVCEVCCCAVLCLS